MFPRCFFYNPIMNKKIRIYTDGGCTGNPGPGGWAAVILKDQQKEELSGGEEATTNNRMELTAVIEALRWWEHHGMCPLEIHTDSQYVKNGINSWIFNWKKNGWKTAAGKPVKNQDLWVLLYDLNQKAKPDWFWVKGHSGDEFNERCDQLVELERKKYSS